MFKCHIDYSKIMRHDITSLKETLLFFWTEWPNCTNLQAQKTTNQNLK